MKQPMLITEALPITLSIVKGLSNHCFQIHVAGSLRRKRTTPDRTATVGDIEIVCQPHKQKIASLFPGDVGPLYSTQNFKDAVNRLGTVIKGNPDGRYMQIELPQGISLDLFMPQPHDYYRQFAIRTGPSDFSHKVLAVAWKKLGWVGTPDGLRREEECEFVKGSQTRKCIVKEPVLPPNWMDEKHFFAWLGLEYVEPYNR